MKKKYYWLIGIVLLLILTNPTMSNFKAFKGTQATESENKGMYDLSRTANFFIFSIYDDGFTRAYLGIGKNFFPIGNSHFESYSEQTKSDSVTTSTDSLPPPPPKKKWIPPADAIALPVFGHKMPLDSFALKIKTVFPEYKGLSNRVLVNKFITKFTKYRDSVIEK